MSGGGGCAAREVPSDGEEADESDDEELRDVECLLGHLEEEKGRRRRLGAQVRSRRVVQWWDSCGARRHVLVSLISVMERR